MYTLMKVSTANKAHAGQDEFICRRFSAQWTAAERPMAVMIAMGMDIHSMRGIPTATIEAGIGQASSAISTSLWPGLRIFLRASTTPISHNDMPTHSPVVAAWDNQ